MVETNIKWFTRHERTPEDEERTLVMFHAPRHSDELTLQVGKFNARHREWVFPHATGFCTFDECIAWSPVNETTLTLALRTQPQEVPHA